MYSLFWVPIFLITIIRKSFGGRQIVVFAQRDAENVALREQRTVPVRLHHGEIEFFAMRRTVALRLLVDDVLEIDHCAVVLHKFAKRRQHIDVSIKDLPITTYNTDADTLVAINVDFIRVIGVLLRTLASDEDCIGIQSVNLSLILGVVVDAGADARDALAEHVKLRRRR